MNRYQPSANAHAVQQRIDDRRAAAANYREARVTNSRKINDKWTNWRCAIGNRLIAVGENLTTPKAPTLPAV